jgi:hypothetical protein
MELLWQIIPHKSRNLNGSQCGIYMLNHHHHPEAAKVALRLIAMLKNLQVLPGCEVPLYKVLAMFGLGGRS